MADSSIDFQKMLDGFAVGASSGNPIESIYNIIPKYDQYQLQQQFIINYFCSKWKLDDVRQAFNDLDRVLGQNRNLGFMSSQNLRNLLAAYTQNELVRGIKVNAYTDSSANSQP